MRLLPVPARLAGSGPALLLAGMVPGRVAAQVPVNHLYDKFQVGASGAAVVLGTTLRIDNGNGDQGTEINFNTLGISTRLHLPPPSRSRGGPGGGMNSG